MSRYEIRERKRLVKSANSLEYLCKYIDDFSKRKKSQGLFEAVEVAKALSKQVRAEVDKTRRKAASMEGWEN